MQPYVDSSITYNSQVLETAYVPISKWVDQKNVVHLHNGILCSRSKEELLPFVTAWMELENIMLSEINQTVKDKYHVVSSIRER